MRGAVESLSMAADRLQDAEDLLRWTAICLEPVSERLSDDSVSAASQVESLAVSVADALAALEGAGA